MKVKSGFYLMITVKEIKDFFGNNSGIVISLRLVLQKVWSSATLKLHPKKHGWYKIDKVFW